LVIFNYDQIESKPKTHPVVRECRGLVLDSQNWEIVAKPMQRFFNWGEVADEMPLFNFDNFIVDSKEDGSLCILYYFNGQWHGNTRGSFGLDNMQFQDFTWRDGFLKAMKIESWDHLNGLLDPEITYVCEFVSPWNKVVRTYAQPKLYLLAAFRAEKELHWDEVDNLARVVTFFLRPFRYQFKGIDEIITFLHSLESDPTFEGVVIRDHDNKRWKIKNPLYLSLHQIRGSGDNLYNPKYLVPFILKNEGDELLTYFKEAEETFNKLKIEVDGFYNQLLDLWVKYKDIENQKEFALAIKGKTPFGSLLFNLRKNGNQTEQKLRQMWQESGDFILKVLKQS
jgi:T4 RnlA family RNA ligase